MLSLAYYLRVIAADLDAARRARPCRRWRAARPRPTPSRPHPSARAAPRPIAIACLAGAATVFFGIIPGPLLDIAADAGRFLTG